MRALVLLLLAVIAVPVARAEADEQRDKNEPAKSEPKKKKPKKKPDDAKADEAKKPAPPPAEPRKPGPRDAAVVAALEKIVAADPNAREQAIADFTKLAGDAPEAVGEWVARQHPTDVADRRKVLTAIKAAIPDKNGRWITPPKQGKEAKADDELDWQKALLALDASTTGVGEVIADVAAIRALAATKTTRAAQILFDIAFADESMIYRDECGRNLRKLEPFSIPALTSESLGKKEERRRYATWQLERLDRQDAAKALGAATGDEVLQAGILDTFRDTRHREAVHAVWAYVDNPIPRVRAAARGAWLAYITGPAPPPAPRKHLKLPGGKMTKYPKPMWLTYRELADNELRKAANELLHEDYALDEEGISDYSKEVKATPINLEEVTKRLFAYYDGERGKRDGAQWTAAQAKAATGDLATATTMVDRLIAASPDRAERAEMAKLYVAHGKQLEAAQKWAEASAAFSKAYGLDPQKPTLAAQHYTLGKSLEAQGKDGGADYRRAIALDPEYAPARTAAQSADTSGGGGGKPVWMLYAAIGAGGIAMLLFGAAMMRRRA